MSALGFVVSVLPCQRLSNPSSRQSPRCETTLPKDYPDLLAQASSAVLAALPTQTLLEVQFPPVPNMATAALNQLLDANRSHTLGLLRALTPRYAPGAVTAVFPDLGEAKLAAEAYGKVPFSIATIPKSKPAYVDGDGVVAVINPGFNVDEWIDMENLQGDKAIVTLNADLDKVRGGYYPKLFYPKLHRVKERFLSRFESVYYVKMFAGGGCLFRCFPDNWCVLWEDEVVWSGDERPKLVDVQRLLTEKRVEQLRNR